MRVIIVRHGKAEADSPSGRDEDRRLKKRGERQALWLGEHFASAAPSLLLSSGHERAIASATLIHLKTDSPLHVERRLELGHSASQALDVIADHASQCGDGGEAGGEAGEAGTGGLMIVGHNPQLGQLLWALTQGAPVREIDLRTGEAVELNFDPAEPIGTAEVVARLRMPED